MSSDFPNLLCRLGRVGVDSVIVGGCAGVVHGCTLLTQDVDICCDFSVANLLKLREAIRQLKAIKGLTDRDA
jgi:hypothetical protein